MVVVPVFLFPLFSHNIRVGLRHHMIVLHIAEAAEGPEYRIQPAGPAARQQAAWLAVGRAGEESQEEKSDAPVTLLPLY